MVFFGQHFYYSLGQLTLGVALFLRTGEYFVENYTKNNEVSIQATDIDGTKLFHAGTKLDQDKIYTSGGRVFCATALGDDLKEAQQKAYNLVESVDFEGAFFRKDIGNKGFK